MRWVYAFIISTSVSGTEPNQRYISKKLHHTEEASITIGKLQKNGFWKKPPEIYVCSTAPFRKERFNKAIRYWEDLGYKFGDIFFHDT